MAFFQLQVVYNMSSDAKVFVPVGSVQTPSKGDARGHLSNMGITAHILRQSLLEGIHTVAVSCTVQMKGVKKCVKW